MAAKSKPRAKRATPSTTEDSFPDATQSATQRPSGSGLPPHDVDACRRDLVSYLLVAERRKVPIRRADIMKNALAGVNPRQFQALMDAAGADLVRVFGIRLVECGDATCKQKSYILASSYDSALTGTSAVARARDQAAATNDGGDEDDAKIGLVMFVLGAIFMRGGQISDEELWEALARLGVTPDRPHPAFGDIRRTVETDLTRQGYIKMTRDATGGGDVARVNVKWGPRAYAETCKRDVLDFVCSFFPDATPADFPAQYAEAVAAGGEDGSGEGEEEEEGMEMQNGDVGGGTERESVDPPAAKRSTRNAPGGT